MAKFLPFHALMPAPEKVAAVAAVPYDVVNTEEAAALASKAEETAKKENEKE